MRLYKKRKLSRTSDLVTVVVEDDNYMGVMSNTLAEILYPQFQDIEHRVYVSVSGRIGGGLSSHRVTTVVFRPTEKFTQAQAVGQLRGLGKVISPLTPRKGTRSI